MSDKRGLVQEGNESTRSAPFFVGVFHSPSVSGVCKLEKSE